MDYHRGCFYMVLRVPPDSPEKIEACRILQDRQMRKQGFRFLHWSGFDRDDETGDFTLYSLGQPLGVLN